MNQRGIALIAGLVLLAAVSLLAVFAASGTVLQRNMAANFRERSLALENAYTAASFARAWLISRPVSGRETSCLVGCILPIGIRNAGELPDRPEFEGAGWWRENGYLAGYNPETASLVEDPAFSGRSTYWLIEEIHFDPGAEHSKNSATGYYRVFSRGEGRNATSVVVLETIVARPWEGEFSPGHFPPSGPESTFCGQFDSHQSCGVLAWRRRR